MFQPMSGIPRAVSAASRLRQKAPYGDRNSSGRMPVVSAISSVLASISAACSAGFWQRSWWFIVWLATRWPCAAILRTRSRRATSSGRWPTSRQPVTKKIAFRPRLSSSARMTGVPLRSGPSSNDSSSSRGEPEGRNPVSAPWPGDQSATGSSRGSSTIAVRVTMVVVSGSVSRSASRLPPQAGARIGTNRTDSATSRRTTSMDSIVDLGTSIGALESA